MAGCRAMVGPNPSCLIQNRPQRVRALIRTVSTWRGGIRANAWMGWLLGMGWPTCHPGHTRTATNKRSKGETALYRHVVFLCSVAIAVLSAASDTLAADSERCQELGRRFQAAKPQITAIEVSLTLFSAADGNCIALATELLDYGASVDARDRFGARPLSHAARFGHLEMVNLLLKHGAPIDARNLRGATALYYAAEGGRTSVAQRLIERGANVKLTGRSGITPVAAAAYAGNDAIVEALLANGADERTPD